MGLRRRKHRRLDPASLRLPLIALIDVVLFLLMYFMVAGTMGAEERELTASLAVDRAGIGGNRTALFPTILRVERAASPKGGVVFRLGDRSFTSQPALTTLLKTLPKDGGIVVKAGPGTSVADLAAAIQACKDAQFTKLSFVGN